MQAFGETKSINAWAKDPRCVVSQMGLRKRLAAGTAPEEALTTPPATAGSASGRRGSEMTAFGETKSVNAWAADPRCAVSRSGLRQRLAQGFAPELALTGPKPEPLTAFGETKSLTGWLADDRCQVTNMQTLYTRVHVAGMNGDDAVTTPTGVHTSCGEDRVARLVEGLTDGPVARNARGLPWMRGLELDLYLPDRAMAVEYNGLFWHSERFRSPGAHHAKWAACAAAGVQLVQVWEDDWERRRPIVETMLAHKLGRSRQLRIAARACTVDLDVPGLTAAQFLSAHHLQGPAAATVRAGLRGPGGDLVAVCLFKAGPKEWDLVRYATSAIVPGGFTRLLTHFRRAHPGPIKTFADLSQSDGGLYEASGFERTMILRPDYSYLVGGQRVHKFNYRKARFAADPHLRFEEGWTERQAADANGLLRVWDAGKLRYFLP